MDDELKAFGLMIALCCTAFILVILMIKAPQFLIGLTIGAGITIVAMGDGAP